jgi:hypothetical protein
VETIQDIAEAAHAKSARLIVSGDPRLIELAGADGVLGAAIPPELHARFPEAMQLGVDPRAGEALAKQSIDGVRMAAGLVEAEGLAGAALAHLAPHGAIVDRAAFSLLAARKRHAALRSGNAEPFAVGPGRIGILLRTKGDEVAVVINGSQEVWAYTPEAPTNPIDLLGSHVEHGAVMIKPGDVALLVRSPAPDRTRF